MSSEVPKHEHSLRSTFLITEKVATFPGEISNVNSKGVRALHAYRSFSFLLAKIAQSSNFLCTPRLHKHENLAHRARHGPTSCRSRCVQSVTSCRVFACFADLRATCALYMHCTYVMYSTVHVYCACTIHAYCAWPRCSQNGFFGAPLTRWSVLGWTHA